jgi:YD repeat-containing protein
VREAHCCWADGRVWERKTPGGDTTQFTYDEQGRIVRKIDTHPGQPTRVTTTRYGDDGGIAEQVE